MAIPLPALISSGSFAGLLIYLDSLSLVYYMLSMLLLVIGVFFLIFMLVPGKLRQWGFSWLDKVFTFTLISVISTLVLTATVTVALAAMTLIGTAGWGIASLVTITVRLPAFLVPPPAGHLGFSATVGALPRPQRGATSSSATPGKETSTGAPPPSSNAHHAPTTVDAQSTAHYDCQGQCCRGTPPRPSRPSAHVYPHHGAARPSTRARHQEAACRTGTPPGPHQLVRTTPQLRSSPGTTVLNGAGSSDLRNQSPRAMPANPRPTANATSHTTPASKRPVEEPPTPAPAPQPRPQHASDGPGQQATVHLPASPQHAETRTPKAGDQS